MGLSPCPRFPGLSAELPPRGDSLLLPLLPSFPPRCSLTRCSPPSATSLTFSQLLKLAGCARQVCVPVSYAG